MSCALELTGSLGNIVEVLQWFQLKKESTGEDEWAAEWSEWKTETESSNSHDNTENDSCWLRNCIVAASPTGDLLSLAYKDRIVIFSDLWRCNDVENQSTLSISWKSSIGHTERDKIEALLCLPIVSQKQSSSGAPDWTCVIVGFSSGYISVYTENGLVLFSQIFEESPVISISCRTFTSRTPGFGYSVDLSEELIILYANCVVSIDGFSFLQVLKSCRNQAAKAAASGGEFTNVPSLGYKKWSLAEQEQIHDCVSAGVVPPLLYDTLLHLSSSKGFHHNASSGIPQASQLVTTGRVPFAGVLVAKEMGFQPFMSDIALHYASKLKSALFSAATGWLSRDQGTKHEKNKGSVKIETAQPISFRHTVLDRKRLGLSIRLCSARRLAAITDEFGRISLLDVLSGTVIRIWKGYRDAECGWVDVEGEWGGRDRIVPFFVIYAPRRGILEVWLPQQGPRVAAFNVSKDARLLYMPHTLLGSNTIQDILCRVLPVILLYPNGSLETISIPFHLALSGKTSRQARDLHLLKTLKIYLKEESEEKTLELLKEISTPGIKLQALNLFKCFRYLTPSMADGMLRILQPQARNANSECTTPKDASCPSMDHETRLLRLNLGVVTQLLNLYSSLSALHSQPTPKQIQEEEASTKLSKHLMLSMEETKSLFIPTYIKYFESSKKVVKFDMDTCLSLTSCLNCWEIQSEAATNTEAQTIPLSLVKDICEEIQRKLGSFLFGWPYSLENIDTFAQALFSSGIDAGELISIILSHWLEQESYTSYSTLHFFTLVLIVSVFDQSCRQVDEERSPFWISVRRELLTWKGPQNAHLATIVCRGVEGAVFAYSSSKESHSEVREEEGRGSQASPVEVSRDMLDRLHKVETSASLNDWEGLTHEMVEWNLILRRFELLLPIQRLHKIFSLKVDEALEGDLSLKAFYDKGKGYLTELLSKWIIKSGCDLKTVAKFLERQVDANKAMLDGQQHSDDNFKQPEMEYSKYTNDITIDQNSPWEQVLEVGLDDVALYFHHAFSPDVVFVNIAWEFGALWNRSPNDLTSLQSSIKAMDMISNPYYKNGLAMMMWETWLVDRIQIVSQFVEKFARIPKDRMSLKDIGVSEFSLKTFFELCTHVLAHILQSNVMCQVGQPPNKECDVFWRDQDRNPSLADLCITQKMSCYDLVFLHYQMVTCLYLIATFSIKTYRPFQLFPERERLAFFKPLSTGWNFGSADTREAVTGKQCNFLCRIVHCAVIALPDLSSEKQFSYGMPKEAKDAIELGRNWGVSLDAVRRHYICNLYNSGLDTMAEQAIPMIRDAMVLGSQLIVIAGQRLQYMVSQSPLGTARVLALTSPYITDWIKTLESKALRCPSAPLTNTISMLTRALSFLPESSPEYKTGMYLLKSLQAIYESQQQRQLKVGGGK